MLRVMDNTELAIGRIRSLRMVHFYHIIKEDEFVEAVLAYYDRDKVINLCILDKHYDKLLDKLISVYESEKDSNWIIVDDYSKKILEAALDYDQTRYDEILDNFVQTDITPYAHAGYMKDFILPFVKYVIEQLYQMNGQKLLWNPVFRDWFGSGEISAMCEENKLLFPYKIKAVSAGLYSIDIGNVLMTGNKLNISISYKEDGLKLMLNSQDYPIEGYIKYIIINSEMFCIADISIGGKQIFTDSSKLEETDKIFDLTNTMESIRSRVWPELRAWKLPWGLEIYKKEDVTGYCFSNDACDYIYAVSYTDIDANDSTDYTIYNYAMCIYKNKISGENTQIDFCNLRYGARGYYKANLEGKYYLEQTE